MGQIDFNQIEQSIQCNSKTDRRVKYKQYPDKDRFIIGKYAGENGPAAAVRKFKRILLTLIKVRDTKRKLHKPRKITEAQ